MKKGFAWLLALAFLISGMSLCAAQEAAPQKDIVILYTSDVHCGVESGFGYVGLAAVRDSLEAAGNHVLLVDNGDAIQGEPIGTLTSGAAIIEMMNALKYDAAIPGNHEFDYGMDRFLELTEMAEFPYISANFSHEGELVFDPYVIVEAGGVKIAFVGMTTPDTLTSTSPKHFQDDDGKYVYAFEQGDNGEALYSAIQNAVDSARSEGAKYVIALGHMGNIAALSPWTYADVIANTSGIDAFLDGHSHDMDQVEMLDKDGKTVLRSACGTKMQAIGYLHIGTSGELKTGLYKWGNEIPAPELLGIENDVSHIVDDKMTQFKELLDEVVAHTDVDLTIYDPHAVTADGEKIRLIRRAETNLGNLCADAYRVYTGADVAFINGGGIRTSIEKGEITYNDILLVHPFGNMICVAEVTGQQILDALEFGACAVPQEGGSFQHVSGMSYEIHTDVPSGVVTDENGMFVRVDGAYRVRNAMIGGMPIDLNKTYTLASHNYLLKENGSGFTMFDGCKLLQDETILDNQVLIHYICDTLGGVVGEAYANPYGEGRIVAITHLQE